jgi:hypothetical protein
MSTDGGINIPVGADLKQFGRDLDELPARMAGRIGEAQRRIQAQMARNRLDIKSLSTIGDDERATAAIARLMAANEKLAASLESVRRGATNQAQSLRDAAAGVQRLGGEIAALGIKTAAVAGKSQVLTTGMKGIQDGSRNTGYAILMMSQAIEDAQYGLAAVSNNLPGIVAALGGPAGLAGVVSIVATGANLLYRNWDTLSSLWQSDETRKEAGRMRELADATKEAADRAKEKAAALRQSQGAATDEGAAAAERANKEIGNLQTIKDVSAALADYNRRTGQRGGAPIEEQARNVLTNAALGRNGAVELLRDLFGAGGTHALTPFGYAFRGEAPPASSAALDARDRLARRSEVKAQVDREGVERSDRASAAAEQLLPRLQAQILRELTEVGPPIAFALRKAIEEELERAGHDREESAKLAPLVEAEARRKVEEQLRARALEFGVDPRGAARIERNRAALTEAERDKEAAEAELQAIRRRFQAGGGRPETLSGEGYASRLIDAGLQKRSDDQMQQRQVRAAEKAIEKLEEIKRTLEQRRDVVARFG